MEREIRRRLQLKESNELAIECRRRQKEKEMEEEEAWRAKMLIEMEKVLNDLAVISISITSRNYFWINIGQNANLQPIFIGGKNRANE